MKINLPVQMLFVCTMVFYTTSCSDDDNPVGDPAGTITINMMDEDNGKSELGDSDVYIDDAYNFYSYYSSISSLGIKKGLGNISTPVLDGVAGLVAVEPGNAYQIFRNRAIEEFPSGKLALNVSANYYNVYVDAPIIKNETVVGATVKYVLMQVPDNGLPANETNIGIFDTRNYWGEERPRIEIEFPTTDFQYEIVFDSWNELSHVKAGNKLVITLEEYYQDETFGCYIRVGESYTYVYGTVQ